VLGRIAAHNLHVPVVVHTFHGHVFHSYFSTIVSRCIVRIERWLANISSAIVAISAKLNEELLHAYKIVTAEKIRLIRLGIETTAFQDETGEKRKQFREEFALPDNTVAVGIAGRFVPVKNHRLFIEAATQFIKAQNGKANVQFFLIGDGTEKSKIQALIKEQQFRFSHAGPGYDNSAPFVFTSWRKDMDAVYAGLDIVMLTSLNEGTPVSIMEAMAAGKPVLSTNVGGIAELITDGQTGLLASTATELAAALSQLVNNEQQRLQFGAAAAKDAARFSKSAEAAALSRLYHSLLSQR
jgi:glycosyltransferase involved in cell wall biosynthesis